MMIINIFIYVNGSYSRESLPIRISPSYLTLCQSGVSSLQIYQEIIHQREHPSILTLPSSSSSSSSSSFTTTTIENTTTIYPSSSSSSSEFLSSNDSELLSSLLSQIDVANDTESDEVFFRPSKQFFTSSEITFWSLNSRFLQSSWPSAFKRLFLLTRTPRRIMISYE